MVFEGYDGIDNTKENNSYTGSYVLSHSFRFQQVVRLMAIKSDFRDNAQNKKKLIIILYAVL